MSIRRTDLEIEIITDRAPDDAAKHTAALNIFGVHICTATGTSPADATSNVRNMFAEGLAAALVAGGRMTP